jgi:hypothetical protein
MLSEPRIRAGRRFAPPDGLDRRIVAELHGDALRFRAELDPRTLGYGVCALIRISPTTSDLRAIPEIARESPEVPECDRITGDDCYLMKRYLHSIDELGPILDRSPPSAAPPPRSCTPPRSPLGPSRAANPAPRRPPRRKRRASTKPPAPIPDRR